MGGQFIMAEDNALTATPDYNSRLFGRKWKVSVLIPNDKETVSADKTAYTAHVLSDSDNEDTSLRVTFSIKKDGWTNPNFSEIVVYNMAPDTENLLIQSGTRVMVEAGYVNGEFGVIYDGNIFQPMWEREDNITTKVTFKCIDAMDIIYDNMVECAGTVLQSMKQMIADMASKSRKPFKIKAISETMPDPKMARTKVFFDSPTYYLRKYAQMGGTLPSTIDRDIILNRPQEPLPESAYLYAMTLSPLEGGLIGTPQQTQDGVNFTMLLNPSVTVFNPSPMLIKIDNTYIRQTEIRTGSKGVSRLDEDYVYKVIGVNHVGDTRGSEWYTHVTGVSQAMEGMTPVTFQTAASPLK
jgi:hypothetical protein